MFKSQQIKAINSDVSRLSKKVETLSSSLQEKEAAAAQLQSELEKSQQEPRVQLLEFIKLIVQIPELEHKSQETEEQKQRAELEKEAMVEEMKTKENLKAQIHAQLGMVCHSFTLCVTCQCIFSCSQMNHPK